MNASAPARSSLALRRIALFEGLSDACLDRIAADCDWRMLEARRPLFTRASVGGEVYFLVSGRARITTYSANGREVAFRDCDAGAHFGDLSALDGQPRSADVVTLEPSLLACMSPQAFLALLEREPRLAMQMMRNLALLVRRLTERVIDLSTLGVHTRLHTELLRMAHEAGVADDHSALIDPMPPHVALAGRISTNREQVTRELGALTRRGVLKKEGAHAVRITDVRALEALVAAVRGD